MSGALRTNVKKNRHVEAVIAQGSGHFVPEEKPELVADELERFFREKH
jgi:pimeloyl-ACP methyl ester carboxylesterase